MRVAVGIGVCAGVGVAEMTVTAGEGKIAVGTTGAGTQAEMQNIRNISR